MKINMFEGGRRVLYALMVLYTVTVVGVSFSDKQYAHLTFNVTRPDRAPEYTSEDSCEYDDGQSSITLDNKRITLCFKPVSQGDTKYIPYESDGKTWKGNVARSFEVMTYIAAYEKAFVLADSAKLIAERKLWESRYEHFQLAAVWLVGGLALIWVFGFGIGWIVRGFVGDKRGA